MVRIGNVLLIGVLLIMASLPSRAQTGYDVSHPELSTVNPGAALNGFSFGFDKLLNTYHWNGLGNVNGSAGSLRYSLNEQLLSTVILSDTKLMRDEQLFGFNLQQHWSDLFGGVVRESSYVLSDNQSSGIGAASVHTLFGGVDYRPFDKLMMEPLAGIRFDNQIGQRDRGPSYALSVLSDDIDFGGYKTHLNGRVRYDRLDPRILETHNDTVRIERYFPDQTRNVLRMTYNRTRRDFYFPADTVVKSVFGVANNIETRTENIFDIGDSLGYPVAPRTFLTLQGNISSRSIGRDVRYKNYSATPQPFLNSTIDEFKLDGSAMFTYSIPSGINAAFQFAYYERDESHSLEPSDSVSTSLFTSLSDVEARKNNNSQRRSLMLSLSKEFTPSDKLEFSGSTSILRYDTPSPENTDTRDELRDLLGLTYNHRFTSYFSARTLLEVNLTHLVYLSAERSADNTWNRIFRLSPRIEYTPSENFFSFNTFEVLANYTTYDFEFISPSVRSYAFRQFAFIDSTSIAVTKRFSLGWYHYLRFYERGELQWNAFTEQPLFYFEDKTYLGTARFRVNENLVFSTGIRYFNQSRYKYTGAERELDNFLRSVGPVTVVELNFGARTRIFLNGWYEHQVQTGQNSRDLTTMTMSCNVRI
ncbi:MAG: hypothetical protein ACHQQQ_10740 [Bacteroidota bacterium]